MCHRNLVLASALALSSVVDAVAFAQASPTLPTPPKPVDAGRAPRLVISIVLDQFGSWVLRHHRDRLPADGFLREAIANGAFHERVAYEHANTCTAVGHAALYTGAPPVESGVAGNEVWEPEHHRKYDSTDDHRSNWLTTPTKFSSPLRLTAEGVADVLRRETHARGRVVSVSVKDRSAIYPAGRHPLAAFWFDGQARVFSTSSYYENALPSWLTEWNATTLPTYLAVPPGTPRANALFVLSSRSVAALLDLASRAAREYRLGDDDVPDLLAISISTTDAVGHQYGPESPEYTAVLAETDRLLAQFLKPFLSTGRTAVLISADHGVAPTLQVTAPPSGKVYATGTKSIVETVERALDARFGERQWVEAAPLPRIILHAAAKSGFDHAALTAAARQALSQLEGIHSVFDVPTVRGQFAADDDITRAVAYSITQDDAADFYIVVCDTCPLGAATTTGWHGGPYAHDQEVPVLIYGQGVQRAHTTERTTTRRVAASLARLLRISPPPAAASARPLEGVE